MPYERFEFRTCFLRAHGRAAERRVLGRTFKEAMRDEHFIEHVLAYCKKGRHRGEIGRVILEILMEWVDVPCVVRRHNLGRDLGGRNHRLDCGCYTGRCSVDRSLGFQANNVK